MAVYLAVGGWNTVFGIGFYVLAYLWLKDYVNYFVLLIPCNIIAITNAYLCYKLFVFRTRGNWLREYLRFYVIYGLSTVLSMGLVALGVQVFALHPIVAQTLAAGVTIVASFFGHKNISFAVPRAMTSNVKNDGAWRSQRLVRGVILITLAVAFIYAYNHVLPAIDFHAMLWKVPQTVPALKTVGNDFKAGLYEPGSLLWKGQSPYIISQYPPLPSVIGMFFALLSYPVAYLIQILILFGLNIVTLWIVVNIICAVCRQGIEWADDVIRGSPYTLFALVLFMDLTSYGFDFSIERGNYDIYAHFFAVLGLWLLVTKPGHVWLPVLAISLAVHCKLYPVVLFIIIIWRYGWKCLMPIVVTNALLLLMLGPANLLCFVDKQWLLIQEPYLWIGNHSARSFTQTVLIPLGVSSHWVSWGVTALPVVIWLVGAFLLWKRGYHVRHAMLFFMLSVPLMCVLPSTSNDYKLVILYAPCLMLLAGLLFNYIQEGRWRDLLMIAVLLVAMGFLSSSFYLIPPLWLQNKYPFILLIQAIVLAVIAWSRGIFSGASECRGTGNNHESSLGGQTFSPV